MEDHSKNTLLRALKSKLNLRRNLAASPANTGFDTKDVVKPKIVGNLRIEKVFEDGHTETMVDEHNLVVKQAENLMVYMTAGLRQIGYIELGDPSPVTPPSPEDVGLQQTTGERKAITFTANGNMGTYEALWTTAEANGYNFTEAGLFTDPLGSGVMFARKAFQAIAKTNSFALKFTWALLFIVDDSCTGGCVGVSLIGSSTVTADYVYTGLGGEDSVIIPIDFTVGTKSLDVFLNGQRLTYNKQYYESTIGGVAKGIRFMGFTLKLNDEVYVINRRLA